jgi:hypothetical protein
LTSSTGRRQEGLEAALTVGFTVSSLLGIRRSGLWPR